MTELFALGIQVPGVVRIGIHLDWDLLDYLKTVTLEANHFFRIVRKQANGSQAKVSQNLRAESVLAQVHAETELLVCLDRVIPLLLQFIRLDLGREANASPFLAHVNDHPATGFRHLSHCLLQLGSTITSARAKHVAGKTLAMHSHQHVFLAGDFSANQSEVMLTIDFRAI